MSRSRSRSRKICRTLDLLTFGHGSFSRVRVTLVQQNGLMRKVARKSRPDLVFTGRYYLSNKILVVNYEKEMLIYGP